MIKKSSQTLLILCLFLLTVNTYSQGISINTTGSNADPSAILDVSSNNAGFLIPRVSKIEKSAIPLPAIGLMVYQIDDTTGFWYYNGTNWRLIGEGTGSGSITPGISAGNTIYWNGSHWVVDTVNLQNNGTSVGIGTNNPDPSASLELNGYSKGFLINRMTNTERNAINNPATGLQIFNTTTMCFEYFANGIWQQIHCAVCPLPDDAGSISGSSYVCLGDNSVSFSVPSITNATNYIWNYSGTGVSINGNSNSVTLDFSSSATSGNLTVKGNNQCGDGVISSVFSITVNDIPSVPVAGSHSSTKTSITWNWNTVSGATGYKYNTSNDYSSAIDNGVNTSFSQTNLICNTSYNLYVWAYNNCGNSSETTLSKTTADCWSCGNDFTDSRDGNTYQTIQLGTQCWFKENLNYDQNTYGNDWCYDNNTSYCNTYGRLYDWISVMQNETSSNNNPSGVKGVCPTGWHVPSDAEWCQLENFVEPNLDPSCSMTGYRGSYVGTNLKTGGSSGFDAQPGGCWNINAFGYVGTHHLYWSSTSQDATNAYHRYMYTGYVGSSRYATEKTKGFAVRCIKN